MHAIVAGSGQDIVLIHGSLATSQDWVSGPFSRMSKLGRAIAIDRPGHGASHRVSADRSLRFQAAQLRGFADVGSHPSRGRSPQLWCTPGARIRRAIPADAISPGLGFTRGLSSLSAIRACDASAEGDALVCDGLEHGSCGLGGSRLGGSGAPDDVLAWRAPASMAIELSVGDDPGRSPDGA